jgi:HlyD family secretion protein
VVTDRHAVQDAQLARQKDDATGETTNRSDRVTLAFDQAAVQVGVRNPPAAIANARAGVTSQQAALATAERNFDDTTLRAPADGVITAITGAPGDLVDGGGPAAPLAPGGRIQLPGVGRDPNNPGGAFMVLQPAHTFEMIVPVKQNDVVDIKPSRG